jgi:hypothetical protein
MFMDLFILLDRDKKVIVWALQAIDYKILIVAYKTTIKNLLLTVEIIKNVNLINLSQLPPYSLVHSLTHSYTFLYSLTHLYTFLNSFNKTPNPEGIWHSKITAWSVALLF